MRPVSKQTSLLAIGLLTTGGTIGTAAAESVLNLPELVISGGFTPIERENYGRSSSIITAEEIEKRQIKYAADALRALPGVAVSRTGSTGGLTQVRIRGAEASHTLVLIDGVEVNTPEDGEFDFSSLTASDIERIEVLRGPQSSIYGSNALGGVISITTKSAERTGVEFGGALEGGSDETVAGDAFVRYRNERATLSLSAAALRAGGHDVSDDEGGEDDEDRNITLNAKGSFQATDWLNFGGTLRYTDRESDFDDFLFAAPNEQGLVFEDDLRNDEQIFVASGHADLDTFDGRLAHRLQAGYMETDTQRRDEGAKTSDQTSDRVSLLYTATVGIDGETVQDSDHRLTLAGEFERESFVNNDALLVSDPSQLQEQERTLFGLVAEYQTTLFDRLDGQFAIRQDFNDDFEDETTYSAGLSYFEAHTKARLHGSIGTAVQNPSIFEQFGFIPAEFNGNPDLTPEKSFGWDIGIEREFWNGRALVDVTYFNQDVEDEISTIFPAPDFIATPINQDGDSTRQGIEVTAFVEPIDNLSLSLSYTYTDADDFDDQIEVRRPRHEAGWSGTYTFLGGDASVTVDGRYVAKNTDLDFRAPFTTGNRVELDDYVLLNVAGSYKVTESTEVFGRVQNALDTDYQEIFGYNTPGITAFFGVRARW